MTLVFFCFLYAAFNVTAAMIIKMKLKTNPIDGFFGFVDFLLDYKIIFGLFLIFVSMYFSMKALSLSSFSTVLPVATAINFLLTVMVGCLVFHDKLIAINYMGMIMIVTGVVFCTMSYSGT